MGLVQRTIYCLMCASLVAVQITNSSQPHGVTASRVSKLDEPQQRSSRSIRRGNSTPRLYNYVSPLEEINPGNPRSLIPLPKVNRTSDIQRFIHTPLGEELPSTEDDDRSAKDLIAEVLENQKLLWENEHEISNFREVKQHLSEEERSSTMKSFSDQQSNSLCTVFIISPGLLPSQEQSEETEWPFTDPRLTSHHQVIRMNVNKNVQELLRVLSSGQPREVHPHSVARPKSRSFFQDPRDSRRLAPPYQDELPKYATAPKYHSDYYQYTLDEYPGEEINEHEYDLSDNDYPGDVQFKESEFSAANFGRIAGHKYDQAKFFWDLLHHGWPFWLEK